ncbi:acyltransferase [Spirosoma flavus]
MDNTTKDILLGPVGLIPAICIIAVSLLTTAALSKNKHLEMQSVKYENLDGLKGYLAIIVFISHGATWYFYLHKGNWAAAPSNLYIQMTNLSVSIFFMLSSFFFCNKLVKGDPNWLKLYISRILRLVPIYTLAIIGLFIIVGFLTHFSYGKDEYFLTIFSQFRKWLLFTIKDTPNINNYQNTGIIICYVPWTLRYEWFFYLSLPILSFLLFRNKINVPAILITLIIMIILIPFKDYIYMHFTYFVGGIVSTYLINYGKFSQKTNHWGFSIVISLLLFILILIPPYQLLPLIITGIIFIITTGGNTFFGILSIKSARILGQLSYGVYLFHGLILFCLFKFVLGFEKAVTLSSVEYWFCILLATPLVIMIAFVAHIYIELPATRLTPIVYKFSNNLILLCRLKVSIFWHHVLANKYIPGKWNQNI